MPQFPLFTAVRVGELAKIAVYAFNLAACRICVDQGKGDKGGDLLTGVSGGLAYLENQVLL